jgi:alditol oxidase
MDKRTFIQTMSVLTGGLILSDMIGCNSPQKSPAMNEHLTNWAGNLTYSTGNVHYPTSVEAIQEVVRKCTKLRALGSRHSFNTIADSTENQLSLEKMNKVLSLDKTANTITVESGTRYGDFAPYLDENGYALANLASLPHITVAGACGTGTHGSGIKNGNLSTSVAAIEFVNAAGDVVTLSKNKDGDKFYGAVVNLGAIGILTKVTLDIIPTFKMKQVVYLNMPMSELKNNFDDLESKGYSVSLFTDWKDKNINEVWIKSRVVDGDVTTAVPELYGAKPATKNMHPIASESAENVTDQMGIPGPWYERMPHFKMGFKPSAGKELQAEYFVPIEHAYEAMMAVEKLNEKITPHLFITEIRTINADELWMSPCYKQASATIHFTWKQETDAVMGLLPLIEAQLSPFNAKPHWAKLFTMQPAILQSRYEKLADFKQLVAEYDPAGKFRNEFLQKNLYS